MRILFLGSYHRDAERNQILLQGLVEQGVEVIERNFPLPSLRFRGGGLTLARGLARAALSAPAYLCNTIRGSSAAADVDAVVVGYLGHHDIATLKLLRPFLSALRRAPLVFDPFISLYDTIVSDRQLLRPESLPARALRRFERSLLRLPDLVLADTAAHAGYYRALAGLSEERVAVVPVGVDADLFARQPPPTPGRVCRLLFYGSYIPLHGVHTILEAARLLRDEPVEFRLIGAGQTRPLADDLARRYRLTKVQFADWVPLEQLALEIGKAHLVLGIFGATGKAGRVVPNKVYQALAAGRCVITRDSPAVREMFLPGKHLAVCPPDDPAALAQTIIALRDDPARAAALAAAGCALVREWFSVPAVGRYAVEAIGRVVGSSRHRRP